MHVQLSLSHCFCMKLVQIAVLGQLAYFTGAAVRNLSMSFNTLCTCHVQWPATNCVNLMLASTKVLKQHLMHYIGHYWLFGENVICGLMSCCCYSAQQNRFRKSTCWGCWIHWLDPLAGSLAEFTHSHSAAFLVYLLWGSLKSRSSQVTFFCRCFAKTRYGT